jgi:hypothetical protein
MAFSKAPACVLLTWICAFLCEVSPTESVTHSISIPSRISCFVCKSPYMCIVIPRYVGMNPCEEHTDTRFETYFTPSTCLLSDAHNRIPIFIPHHFVTPISSQLRHSSSEGKRDLPSRTEALFPQYVILFCPRNRYQEAP